MHDKLQRKIRLLIKQDNRCCYCNIKFKNNKWDIPTLEHVYPKCFVWDKTKFKLSCKRCNLYKGNISEELFLQWYICVNIKETYDWISKNIPMKVRNKINLIQKTFPNIFSWNKKKYYITIKQYENSWNN